MVMFGFRRGWIGFIFYNIGFLYYFEMCFYKFDICYLVCGIDEGFLRFI